MQNEASTSRPYVAYEVRSTHPAVLATSSTGGVLLRTVYREQAERSARDYGATVEVVLVHI